MSGPTNNLADKRVLLVGCGGLASPAVEVLARAGLGAIDVVDDDRVDASNLQRQTLFGPGDEGQPKAALAAARIARLASEAGYQTRSRSHDTRVLPESAVGLMRGYDLILDGTDNFASKFLISDASSIAGVSAVQAGAVRWHGWVLASVPGHSACLRCVFEDVPQGVVDTCASAGVVGPVVGVVGAAQASVALRLLGGATGAAGVLWSYEALPGRLRRTRVQQRAGCPQCAGQINDTDASRYIAPDCAA
jgi:adenylyltransferase/sulfurtransferase